jgi:hypothetical protein
MLDKQPKPLSVAEVHAELEKHLSDRRHMGFRNLVGDLLLEPRDPFRIGTRRQPKRWVGLLFGVTTLSVLVFYFSHLR